MCFGAGKCGVNANFASENGVVAVSGSGFC